MKQSGDLFSESMGAEFSPCRKWRYRLWRLWGAKPFCNWLMLNPSTADETANDPTVARCIAYSRKWGYGGCVVTNIFAIRATDPEVMKAAKDPVGPKNNTAILRTAFEAGLLLCAWGGHGKHMGRSAYVTGMLRGAGVQLHCLKLTSEGEPGHPLYLPGDLRPQVFDPESWIPGEK